MPSPRGEQRGVLVFSGSAVIVLPIAEEPLTHELFSRASRCVPGKSGYAGRAGGTGKATARRCRRPPDPLSPAAATPSRTSRARSRRRRHLRYSMRHRTVPTTKKPKTRDFSLSATPRRSSSRAFLSSTQINLSQLVGRAVGCETFASVASYK